MTRPLRDVPLESVGFTGNDLSGQVAVVTGAGRGIGRETALLLAALGAAVVVAEISGDGETTARDIEARGGKATFVQTDVSDEESVASMFGECRKLFGNPTILVNNAIYSPVKPLADLSSTEWGRVLSVNLGGAFFCIRQVLPHMKERHGGTIVNLISAPSMPYAAAYAATKQALESLAHSLAGEMEGTGVSVVAYGPGMVDTPGGVSAFHELAGYLGVTFEQMTRSGLNPGYDGLAPAYDSALALVYAILHAAEYHGQTVTMHELLPEFVPAGEDDLAPTPETPGEMDLQGLQRFCEHALAVSLKMQSILEGTEAEFERLPFFARPMARAGLKRKSGASARYLTDMVTALAAFLHQAAGGLRTGDPVEWVSGRRSFLARWQDPEAVLARLAAYFREVPSETERFVRDKDALEEITHVCAEREAVALELSDLASRIRR